MELTPALTFGFVLILVRTSSMLVSAPLLSHRGIPSYTKVGFAVVLSLVLVPLTQEHAPVPPANFIALGEAVVRETLFGLGLGLAMNIVFMAMSAASHLIGVQVGFGLGGVLNPLTGSESGALDQFFMVLATLVFFTINGHYLVITALSETMVAVPLGSFDPFAITPSGVTTLMAGLTITAVRVAMPVMVALFLADFGMGLVARTVPQMNILMVGLPLKVGVGLVVLLAALPMTMQVMNGVVGSSLAGSSETLLGAR